MECHNEETKPLMNIKSVVSNRMCSGCGLCSSVCPKGSISMYFNTIGNILPIVDDTCIDCGLCSKVCPGSPNSPSLQIDCDDVFVGNIKETYIGRSINDKIYKNSQSGGIVTALIAYLLNNRLIDAAIVAKFSFGSPYPRTESIIVTDVEQLYETQKSIYTPVDILSRLKHTKTYEKVAVVGLPCQMEALYLAQNKGLYKNVVFKIGLICDRILSRSIYLSLMPDSWCSQEEKPSAVKKNQLDPYKVFFKDKKYNGYKVAYMNYLKENGNYCLMPPYSRHYVKDYYTHPRCRICFDKLNVYADITCGDPWGMENVDWENGDSLVLSRTSIGQNLLEEAERNGFIKLTKCNTNDVLQSQGIRARKNRCLSAIEVYKKNNWDIPPFYDNLSTINPSKKQIDEQQSHIVQFIETGKKSLPEILMKAEAFRKKNARIDQYRTLKKKVKDMVKSIIKYKSGK